MIEIKTDLKKIKDEKAKKEIEKTCAAVSAAQKRDGVWVAHTWAIDPFLIMESFIFVKKDTNWYAACIQGCCLSLLEVERENNLVIINCECDGEAIRLHLTLLED